MRPLKTRICILSSFYSTPVLFSLAVPARRYVHDPTIKVSYQWPLFDLSNDLGLCLKVKSSFFQNLSKLVMGQT